MDLLHKVIWDKNELSGKVAVVVFSFLITFCFYSKVILNPNTTTFGQSGDAIKNYWVVDYHLKNDSSLLQFSGSNFPVGENYIYTDGQLSLTTIFYFLRSYFDIADYGVAIVNMAMVISLVMTPLILFSVFRIFGVQLWLAVFFSLVVGFMSPQIFRMAGHFGLSYGFIVPLFLYLTLLQKKKWRLGIFLSVNLVFIFISLIHLYYFLIIGGFLGLIYLIRVFNQDDLKKSLVEVCGLIVSSVIVFVVVKSFDSVFDRPNSYESFLYYRAIWESVLLPVNLPHGEWWSQNLFEIKKPTAEGVVYMGMSFFVTLLIACYMELVKGVKKFFKNEILLSSLLLLLFSLGIPFVFNLEFLVEYLGVFQQFRSIGRFAWVFFYVGNVYLLIWLSRKYFSFHSLMKALIIFSFIVSGYEIFIFNSKISKRQYSHEGGVFSSNRNVNLLGDFEGVMPLDPIWVGSECVDILGSGAYREALNLSRDYGLSLVGNNLSRVSYSRTIEMLKFVHGSSLEFLKGREDVLILKPLKGNSHSYNQGLYKGEVLARGSDFEYLRFSPDLYKENVAKEDHGEGVVFNEVRKGVHELLIPDSQNSEYLLFKFDIPKFNDTWPKFRLLHDGQNEGVDLASNIYKVDDDFVYVRVKLPKTKESVSLYMDIKEKGVLVSRK